MLLVKNYQNQTNSFRFGVFLNFFVNIVTLLRYTNLLIYWKFHLMTTFMGFLYGVYWTSFIKIYLLGLP